jgi:Leu/Phe-tRNA-protein transferase
MTKHLETMGAKELPRTRFLEELNNAKATTAYFAEPKLTGIDIKLLNALCN